MIKSKYEHFNSKTHDYLDKSTLKKYKIQNITKIQVDEIMNKWIINYNKNNVFHQVQCFLKLLTTSNHARNIRIKPEVIVHFLFQVPKKLILTRINKDRYLFSRILELRITFISSFKDMTYEHHSEKTLPMCAIRKIQLLSDYLNLIICFNRNTFYPMIRKYSDIP